MTRIMPLNDDAAKLDLSVIRRGLRHMLVIDRPKWTLPVRQNQFFSVYAKSYLIFLGLIIEHKYFMNFKQFERRICFKTQTKYLHIALYYIKIDATQMLRNFFFALEGKRPNRELLTSRSF